MPAASERASREAAGPRPAAVRYNDWRRVRLPEAATFVPALPVSVVVPCFEAPDALALTLAGLARQAWPRALLEVVVVDDGSEPPLELPALPVPAPLDVKLVRQARRGFGLARARNAGARAAAHPILVFLDGDTIAEAGAAGGPCALAPRGLRRIDAGLLRVRLGGGHRWRGGPRPRGHARRAVRGSALRCALVGAPHGPEPGI